MRSWILSGNHVLFSKIYDIKKTQRLTQHQADRYGGKQMRATACIVTCYPRKASVLFWRCRLRSYHSQLISSGRRKPLTPRREIDYDASVEVLNFHSVFQVERLVLIALVLRPNQLGSCRYALLDIGEAGTSAAD